MPQSLIRINLQLPLEKNRRDPLPCGRRGIRCGGSSPFSRFFWLGHVYFSERGSKEINRATAA
jgi:hypothetical protein